MKVNTFSYRHAEEILTHPKYIHIYNELISICQDAPIPVYKDKSKKQKKLDVVQQLLNTYFRQRLIDCGWEDEPLATPDEYKDSLRSDFRKTFTINSQETLTLQIEVEFGNVASSYRDYFKFQLSYAYSLTDICILILPSYLLGKRMDSGVSNFEKTKRELPSFKLSLTTPSLIIGLDYENEQEWDVKSIEPNLDIIKNPKDKYSREHNSLVRRYIDSINMIKEKDIDISEE